MGQSISPFYPLDTAAAQHSSDCHTSQSLSHSPSIFSPARATFPANPLPTSSSIQTAPSCDPSLSNSLRQKSSLVSHHPMVTRAKAGIFKKKIFTASLHSNSTEPDNVQQALLLPEWKKAMIEEYAALMNNQTWVLVPANDQMKIVDHKWVFRTKYHADGSVQRYKARLVAKGFQQTPGVDFFETFSPVIKPCTIRVIFTLAVTYKWDIQQIDINNAFLNGDLQEVVYMTQPVGFVDPSKPSHVCQLKKALYGLKQAPRAWFEKLKQALVTWGFKASTSDSSLFIFSNTKDLIFLLVYVDDILVTGNNVSLIKKILDDLNKCFALKTLGFVGYFLGFEVHRDENGILLTQSKYISDLLKKANMINAKSCSTPMCSSNKLARDKGDSFEHSTLYRSIIGGLQYLTLSRPDIAFSVNKLSQFLQTPTDEHWKACKRVLRYLKGTSSVGLQFKPADRLVLEGYADADWASSLDDRRSTSGYCIYLGGNLIVWRSKK